MNVIITEGLEMCYIQTYSYSLLCTPTMLRFLQSRAIAQRISSSYLLEWMNDLVFLLEVFINYVDAAIIFIIFLLNLYSHMQL